MNELTNVQIIEQNGKPAFAVLPWDTYEAILPALKARQGIPQQVLELSFNRDISIIAAWREYLGLSQSAVAAAAGMKQPSLARIEKGEGKPRRSTLERLATAMNLTVEQLCLDD